MIFENLAERPLNITSVPSNFKSFIKQVYQKKKNGYKILTRKTVKIITSEQK